MTSDELITRVREIYLGPVAESVGTSDSIILSHANSVIRGEIFPMVIELGENYCVRKEEIDIVEGQSEYSLPTRAFTQQIKDVAAIVGDQARETIMTLIDANERDRFETGGNGFTYYLEDDLIVLTAAPTGKLRVRYWFRPGELVQSTDYRTAVTGTDSATRTVEINSTIPAGWDDTQLYDIVSGTPPYAVKAWDLTATSVSGTTITFATSNPIDGSVYGTKNVGVGNIVTLAGKAPGPMMPETLYRALEQGTALRVAQAFMDQKAYGLASERYERELSTQIQSLADRIQQRETLRNHNSTWRRGSLVGFGKRGRGIFR